MAYVAELRGQIVACPACHGQFEMQSIGEPTAPPIPPPSAAASEFSDLPHLPVRRTYVERSGFTPAKSIWDIFDFHFERYVTPIIVRVTWAIAVFVAGAWVFGMTALCIYTWLPEQQGKGARDEIRFQTEPRFTPPKWLEKRVITTIAYAHAVIAAVLVLLWVRVVLESMIVLFNIAKSLASIDRKTAES
jgi:hypothetical protein